MRTTFTFRPLLIGGGLRRQFSSGRVFLHENPLGLPKRNAMGRGLPVKQRIPGVKKVVLVSSGKGGVGKSTVSANLAVSLQQLGKRVGLLDADIFGPSIPMLMNLKGEPRLSKDGKLLPLKNYGVETMSMGFLIEPDTPVVWRGMMVMKALQQLLFDVKWSDLDVLVVDMPPGTGDTQLTISQQIHIHGAVIVSTPQDVALLDTVKGIAMFNKVDIPILGLVENMSYFTCPNCSHESHLFGDGGAKREAKRRGVKLLGEIPLNEEICIHSDKGKPIVLDTINEAIQKGYLNIAKEVVASLEKASSP